MKRQIAVVALALLVYPSFSMPATANPIAAPACKDIPSCGVAGIIIGTEIIGGVLYYVVKNATGVVHRVRARQQPVHRSNEQYQEELIYIEGHQGASTECYRIAERKTGETGKKWRVKSNRRVKGTGGIEQPGKLYDWECIVTDAPPEQ